MENNLQEVYDKVIDLGNLSEETKEEKKPKKLTSEEVKLITETLNNVVEQNANLKVIADLPSNNGVSESESDLKGEDKVVTVNVNPVTNEKTVVGTTEEEITTHIGDSEVIGYDLKMRKALDFLKEN